MRHLLEILEARTMLSAAAAVSSPEHTQLVPMGSAHAVSVPAVSRQLLSKIQKLEGDLETVRIESGITDGQVEALENDAAAVLEVATKPSAAAVKVLLKDAKRAAKDKVFSLSEKSALTADVGTVLQSANVPPSIGSSVTSDIYGILTSANISTAQIKLIVGDVDGVLGAFK